MDARILDHAFNDFGGRVDHLLRIIAWVAGLMCFPAIAVAGTVALTPAAGVTTSAGGFVTASNFVGQFSGAAFNSSFTTQVAGKSVVMPASMRLAANAGQFAVSAIKLNPSGLVLGAVASWLLTEGFRYVNGQWEKNTQTPPRDCYKSNSQTWVACSLQEAIDIVTQYNPTQAPFTGAVVGSQLHICRVAVSWQCHYFNYQSTQPAQNTWNPVAEPSPNTASLPDNVASELAAKVPLPLQNPALAPKVEPLSEPRIDPVTGKKVRDVANITPASDSKTANVEIAKQELDPVTSQPKTDANGNPEPQIEIKDMCEKNPDAAGCKPLDEVEDQNIENRDISLSIIPLPGFGPGTASCPAPVSLGTKGGQAIQWEWTKFCDFSLGIRPLVLAFAWIAAAMIVVGVARKQGA